MGEGTNDSPVKVELPTILGQKIEPWINLIHVIGLPWVIIILSAFYGIPYAKESATTFNNIHNTQADTNKKIDELAGAMKALDQQAVRAMPMLEEATQAIPILREIKEQSKNQAKERHNDLSRINAKKEEDCNE